MNGETVLEAVGLSKYYGGLVAVDQVDVTLRRGEILALIGDNGAGKSTVVKMLCGALRPDAGEIFHRGEAVEFHSPSEAQARGIEAVYQDLALAPHLDVASNLYLGREIVYPIPLRSLSILNRRAMARGAAERIRDLEISVPSISGMPITRLSGGQRQAVAVARAAAWATDVLFMDEPTAALGVRQSTAVLHLGRRLAAHGLAIVVITHSLPQVMEFADRIVVLRHGRKVADMPRKAATPDGLVSLIVGFDPGEDRNGASTADTRRTSGPAGEHDW